MTADSQKGNTPRVVAFIPARAGSKRIRKKNLRLLGGKPLVEWSIEAALQSRRIDAVYVSSDDIAVLEIARTHGCYTIHRPAALSGDEVSTVATVEHALETVSFVPDTIVLLQPTSPLRTARHIDEAMEEFYSRQASAVVSVTPAEHSPFWHVSLSQTGRFRSCFGREALGQRSQDLVPYYRINGAIYICETACFRREKTFFPETGTYGYVMDRKASVDIDDEIDLQMAECLLHG